MPHVQKIGKTKWVMGLYWESFEDVPTKQELEIEAQQLSANAYSLRTSEAVIQCGFVSLDSVNLSGCFSLAALLADSEEQPWIGTFDLGNDLFWYLAVRDGHAILPDGDIVGTKDEIDNAKNNHSGFSNWTRFDENLAQLEARIKAVKARKTAVKPIKKELRRSAIIAGTLTVIIIASFAGWHYWTEHKKHDQIERARQAMLAKLRATGPVVEKPQMESLPDAAAWIGACKNSFYKTPLSYNGWLFDGIKCDGATATKYWKRGPYATDADAPPGAVDTDSDTQTEPLEAVRNGQDSRIALSVEMLMMKSSMQKAGIKIIFSPVNQGASPSVYFKFDSPISIFQMNMNVPGLTLTSVVEKVNGTDQLWHIEGVLYGK